MRSQIGADLRVLTRVLDASASIHSKIGDHERIATPLFVADVHVLGHVRREAGLPVDPAMFADQLEQGVDGVGLGR